jgi:hypothetical protein
MVWLDSMGMKNENERKRRRSTPKTQKARENQKTIVQRSIPIRSKFA